MKSFLLNKNFAIFTLWIGGFLIAINPLQSNAQCFTGEEQVVFTLSGGSYPSEKGWLLFDMTTSTPIDSGCFGTFAGGTFVDTFCVTVGNTIKFLALDDYGDGLDGATYSLAYGYGVSIGSIGSNNYNIPFPFCGANYSNNEIADSLTFTASAPPSCFPPSSLGTSNVTSTSASLGWTAGGTETMWDVEWGASGFTLGTGTMVSANSNPTSISNLSALTSYSFYVRALCGSDTSSWAGPFTFSTPCAAFTSPYYQNFDGTTDPNIDPCWSVIESTSNTFGWIYTENSTSDPRISGANSVEFYNSSASGGMLALVSPYFSDLDNTKRIRFSVQDKGSSSYVSDVIVGVMSDPTDTSTYTPIDTIFKSQLSANWLEVSIDLPTGLGNHVVIGHGMNSTYDYFWIDDFYYEDIPSCPNPTFGTVDSVTSTMAFLSWVNGGSETSWNIEYGPSGFNQGSGTLMTVTTNPTSISGLTPNTMYQAYVQADCGNNDLSPWNGPINILTSCSPYTVGYSQNFDGTAYPAYDACWSAINATNNANAWVRSENSSFDPQRSAPNSIEFYSSSATSGLMFFISPEFSDLDTTKRVRFYVQDEGSSSYIGNLIVGIMSNPTDTSTFTPLDTIFDSELSANWLEVSVNFDSYQGSGKYVALAYQVLGTFDYLYIDDFYYENIPSCFKPTNFASSNITSTSVDFTWTANSYPNNWEVEYGAVGYTPGSGTSTFVTDTMASISNLSDATTFDFYVREICSPGDSSIWEGPLQVTTLCLPSAAPFLENFDGLPLVSPYTALPNCWDPQTGPDYWDVTNDLVNTGHTYLPNIGDHTTGSGNYMWIDASGDITANEMVSPMIDMSNLSNPWAGFWFASFNANNSVNHTIALNVWDGSAWVNIASESGNFNGWVQVKGKVPSNIPSTTKFRIYAIAATGTTSSTYYFNDLGVDDFFVDDVPFSGMAMASANSVCAGDTVMLYGMGDGGSGSYTYSWSGANIINASADTAWYVAATSGNIVVSIGDGSSTIMDTVMVNVNPSPNVSITAQNNDWCNELDLFVTSNAPGMASWSNGDFGANTSVSLNDGLTQTISVSYTDTLGCTGTASYMYFGENHVESYTMIAKNMVRLMRKNKVLNGGVGVTNLGGFARIDNFSGPEGTNGFVIADNLMLRNSTNYTSSIDTAASALVLPMHETSSATQGNKTVVAQRGASKTVNGRNLDVIAQPNSTIILNNNRYGDILVKRGATVVFNHPNVQIRSLYVQNSSLASMGGTVLFNQSGMLRVKEDVYLGSRSSFNPSSRNITVYVGAQGGGGDFVFKAADIDIVANVYVLDGMIKANTGNSANWSKVDGRMIADSIISNSPRVRWGWSNCNNLGLPPAALKSAIANADENGDELKDVTTLSGEGYNFTIAPNPTTGIFTMQLNGSLVNSNEDIQVTITSQDGRMVENKTFNNLNGSFNRDFSLENYSNGIYFVTILVGNEILKEKIVLTR